MEFIDGDSVWKLFDATSQFEEYCRSNREVYYLLYTSKLAQQHMSECNRTPIASVIPGVVVYVPLRFFSYAIFDELDLPDKENCLYVVLQRYTKWDNRAHTRIEAVVPVFESTYSRTGVFVFQVGQQTELLPNMVLVTDLLIQQHPAILRFIADKHAHRRVTRRLRL